MTPRNELANVPVTVVIPAHNEAQAIGRVVSEVYAALSSEGRPASHVEVIVVDDGSSDDTARIAEEAGARVIRHETNIGYGAALKTGIRAATHDIIVTTDGDGTYPAAVIPHLVEELARCDMAVGARIGPDVHIPIERRPAKWLLTKLAVYLAQKPIPDLNSGLRAFRRSEVMRFLPLCPNGFSFSTTITLAYLCNDMTVHYLPINYHPRVGKSKIRPLRDTKNVFVTIVRSIVFFNPLRVFVPLAFVMFFVATLVALFVRDSHGNILDGTISILVLGGVQMIMLGFLADAISRLR
jgi:glycosyltransferase involved in cell wall biosynthesis